MQRTNIVELKPSKLQKKILKQMMLLSSSVYNQANYITRQKIFSGEKILPYFEAKQKIQSNPDYQLLGRSYASPRLQIYFETNSARFRLIKSKTQKRVGLPKYLKNRKTNTTIPSYLVMDNCQYSLSKSKASIPLSNKMRKAYKLKNFNIHYNGILKWKGLQQRGQIHFKNNKFYLYQSVEVKEKKNISNTVTCNIASLDLGIKRFLSVFISNGSDWKTKSRRFHNQWLYLTSKINEEQSKLNLGGRKTSKQLSKLYSKRKSYLNNLFNNLTAKMFRVLARNNVKVLIVGDVKNIREDNDKGSILNQMMHNYWSFDIMLAKIKNKCEEYGIELRMQEESYTSKTCPICGDCSNENNKDRIFICSMCGYVDDRDIVGARNILSKSMCGSDFKSIHWGEISPLEEAW
jgi:putative transposase